MRQNEITSFEQASEDLFEKAKRALHYLGCYELHLQQTNNDLPENVREVCIALRDAVWEMEAWKGE